MGVAAPQLGIDRAAAIVRTADGEVITLLNPRVIEQSSETDEQYEGCWSFFDVQVDAADQLQGHEARGLSEARKGARR
ncbi:peptide deformylase [Streptomyces sp. TRM49041]|uniref:peptide deformylase n=1 Tax=Streptomyces sp. TRM49041 TaxID=2603216 RepID=UPI0021CC754A|nr:peptide deformylase [Streptomyces sp. TRM49041]